MRRKQRAHWKSKKSHKDNKKLQKEVQSSTRRAEKDFSHNVISGNLKQDPKRFSPMSKVESKTIWVCPTWLIKTATSLVILQREPTS